MHTQSFNYYIVTDKRHAGITTYISPLKIHVTPMQLSTIIFMEQAHRDTVLDHTHSSLYTNHGCTVHGPHPLSLYTRTIPTKPEYTDHTHSQWHDSRPEICAKVACWVAI